MAVINIRPQDADPAEAAIDRLGGYTLDRPCLGSPQPDLRAGDETDDPRTCACGNRARTVLPYHTPDLIGKEDQRNDPVMFNRSLKVCLYCDAGPMIPRIRREIDRPSA